MNLNVLLVQRKIILLLHVPFRESSLVTLSRNFEEIHIILIMINIYTCKYVKKKADIF